MIIGGYIFVNSWMFYFLILIPILVFLYIKSFHKKTPQLGFSTSEYFKNLSGGFRSGMRHVPFIIRMLALSFFIIALARPQKKIDDDTITEHSIEGIDIVISLDISYSMKALDFSPNRLEASKVVAQNFIKKRPTDRIGLVVYEGESYTACALTTDHESLLRRFKHIESGQIQGGTAIGMGLATAVNRLRDSSGAKSKVVILLTDGENNAGKVHPKTAADYAKEYGIRVYTIGVGSKGKVKMPVGKNQFTGKLVYDYVEGKIDEALLTDIAEQTGGKYYRAKNKKQLAQIYDEIDKLEKAKINTSVYKRDVPEAFHVFALIGLVLLIGEWIFKNLLINSLF